MNFYLIGVDYKTTPIELRELIYKDRERIADLWKSSFKTETAVLSTCNRFEIYILGPNAHEMLSYVSLFYGEYRSLLFGAYFLQGKEAVFRHLLRLACGLESQLKGELQILRQLDVWRRQSSFPPALAATWHLAMKLARRIRFQVGLNKATYNIASIVLKDLTELKRYAHKVDIIVIGTGKIAELFAVQKPAYVHLSFAAHKNYAKAQYLAEISAGKVIKFKDLGKEILNTDALIGATSSPHAVFRKEDFLETLSKRDKLLYIYDLALPRDIDPAVGAIEGVVLKNLDNLSYLFDEFNKHLDSRINAAECLAEKAVKYYVERYHEKRNQDWHTPQSFSYKAG